MHTGVLFGRSGGQGSDFVMSLSVKTLVRCYFGLAVIDSCCPLLASWCAARAVPLRVRYLNASIGWVHSLMDGDKIDGG